MATYEDFLKDVEALKRKYGDAMPVGVFPRPGRHTTSPQTPTAAAPLDLRFDLKPRDLKAYLDRYVIKQDEAKKTLAIAICDHYHHAMACERDATLQNDVYTKPNVLLMGPTGVGKTYLVRLCAKLVGVPFVKADATKFSETGYVGGNVEDLVRDLLMQAQGDVRLVSYGIIYLDEVDKLATPPGLMGRDVSGRGVQIGLLKLLEETDVDTRTPYDLPSQLQAMLEWQQKGKVDNQTINTRHILFIVSGAFHGLQDIIAKRLRTNRIGFGSSMSTKEDEASYLQQATSRDFIDFGFEPEFIGRLPVHVVCQHLSEDDLYHILKHAESSILTQYQRAFSAYGIEVLFADAGLRRLAQQACAEHTGARGLVTVCEQVLREFKFALPSTTITQFVVTERVVDHPSQELQQMMQNPPYHQQQVTREHLARYAADYAHRHDIILRFDDAAVEAICRQAVEQGVSPQHVCDTALKSYEYGLNLIKKNSGQTTFVITPEVLQDPEGTLERWIRDSYASRRQDARDEGMK